MADVVPCSTIDVYATVGQFLFDIVHIYDVFSQSVALGSMADPEGDASLSTGT